MINVKCQCCSGFFHLQQKEAPATRCCGWKCLLRLAWGRLDSCAQDRDSGSVPFYLATVPETLLPITGASSDPVCPLGSQPYQARSDSSCPAGFRAQLDWLRCACGQVWPLSSQTCWSHLHRPVTYFSGWTFGACWTNTCLTLLWQDCPCHGLCPCTQSHLRIAGHLRPPKA